ncbi:pentatricopeptide repeat-containing protein At2g20710, mitochondrial-like [Punica granatum]|nr:pentatricopeptide repeat-containing protein At2g20710, mitochondrial-like [Punica granatum]OWM91029.1 hypothetical protein CDL15_Pgr023362 [Punica granatum]
MNLLRLNLARRNAAPGVFRVVFFSTGFGVAATSPPRDSLNRRIMRAGDPMVSMADVLNKWVGEGKQVNFTELNQSLRTLRKFRRGKHALQLLEWMIEQADYKLTNSEIAVRLDLIAKVRSLEEAEEFFEQIPEKSRDFRIYGALLSCYALEKSMEKAEATLQKMRVLGYVRVLSYNVMLNLYAQTKQYEKMDVLMQEMKERGHEWDNYTYNTRLNAYALASDLEGMEKLLSKMEADPYIKMDWNSYVVAANGYLKSGQLDKALPMMKKAENLTSSKNWKRTFEILLTMYGQIGSKDDLYQLWNMYKQNGKFDNTTYLAMITSLVRLDDVTGAEKIMEEWEYGKIYYDVRIPRFLISTYCKKGFYDKAEAYMNRLVEIGEEPDASLWDALASGYELKKEILKAVEALKKAISVSKPGWRPNKFTLASCLDYLKEKGEAETAQELLLSLRERGILPEIVCGVLLDYVNNDKDGSSSAINQLEDAQRQSRSLSSELVSKDE